jgi:putative transposase
MDEQTHVKGFAWQEGYGAFTVGVSQKPRTVDYMKRQAENHRNLSFEEEFLAFLKKRAIDYNPKYVRG